jgi:hypothetical protein
VKLNASIKWTCSKLNSKIILFLYRIIISTPIHMLVPKIFGLCCQVVIENHANIHDYEKSDWFSYNYGSLTILSPTIEQKIVRVLKRILYPKRGLLCSRKKLTYSNTWISLGPSYNFLKFKQEIIRDFDPRKIGSDFCFVLKLLWSKL